MKFIQNLFKKSKNKSVYKFYRSINELPTANYFKIIETDDLSYLFKVDFYAKKPEPLSFFADMFLNFAFEFEQRDNKRIEKLARIAYLKSLNITNPQKNYGTQAAILESSLKVEDGNFNLNETVTNIELILKIQAGSIDIYKLPIARFNSYFYAAEKKVLNQNKKS